MDSGNCEQKQSNKQATELSDNPETELQEVQDSQSSEAQNSHESKAIWEQDVRNASPIFSGSPKDSDAQSARPTPTVETPVSLREKYTFIKEIGRGTQGRIYLAETNADHFQVAIKQLMIESVTNWKAYELFHREAEILSSLRINGVARFYDAIECLTDDPPCSYIVQEYIPGQSLNDMLKAGHRFSLDRVYDIILQLLGIIGKLWLHNPPVIHRDIKPSNIILKPLGGDEFMVYLIDFGAVASPKVQGGGSTVAGTYGYMPPEQLMGKPVPQSDIYSLAAVAVHLITGISPANLPVKDFHLIFEPEMQNMPPALVQTLREMLEPNVESRLCDMEELCHRFLDFSHAVYDSRLTGLVASLSDEAYFAKLRDVQFYGQDGNIELWQRLPDQTPRFEPAISDDESEESEEIKEKNSSDTPEESKPSQTSGEMALPFDFETQFKALLSEIDSQSEGYDFIKDNVENLLGNDIWHALKKENTLAYILFLFGMGQFFTLYLTELSFITFIPAILCIIIIGTLYIFHIIHLKAAQKEIQKKHAKKVFVPVGYSIPFSQTRDYRLDELWYLLKNGRKTIATIVGIEYKQTAEANIENRSDNSLAIERNKKECSLTCHGRPNFEIHYKFNPPDDMREEDLVHKIVVHIEPEGHYQVGDPFPIVYMIMPANERFIKERVISVPFPFPAEDPVLYTDIVFGDAYQVDDRQQPFKERNQKDFTKRNVYEVLDYLKNAPHTKYGDWDTADERQNDVYRGIHLTNNDLSE